MTDMAESADVSSRASTAWPAPVPAAAMWLPGHALSCYEGDADRRAWLLTPGLLTQRIRQVAGDRFAMHVLNEGAQGDEHVREIDMRCGERVWLFAHTRVPAATIAAHPWLATIGSRTLGEALAHRDGLERAEFRYALLGPESWLIARALSHAGEAECALWVRHSAFRMSGCPFALYEVFLPSIGQVADSRVAKR